MRSFLTTIGDDLYCDVEFDFTPEQKEILNPPDNAQPGFPAEVEITAVLLDGHDISECLNEKTMNKLRDEAFEEMRDRSGHYLRG